MPFFGSLPVFICSVGFAAGSGGWVWMGQRFSSSLQAFLHAIEQGLGRLLRQPGTRRLKFGGLARSPPLGILRLPLPVLRLLVAGLAVHYQLNWRAPT